MVAWEIEKACALGKRIVAVKTHRQNISPVELYSIGTSWAMSLTYLAITQAIANAR